MFSNRIYNIIILFIAVATLIATFIVPEVRAWCGLDSVPKEEKPKLHGLPNPSYIICESAHSSKKSAEARVKELKSLGFNEIVDYLWIPNFSCLSNAELYEVYLGPFGTLSEANAILCDFNVRFSKTTYGVKIWEGPTREEFRCND